MSVDKFKFVSPGIFLSEIDESTVDPLPERMGPLVIGRFEKGPAGRPVTVDSFREFVSIFGNPAAGNASGDIWRTGEMTAPTYAAFAAQAWLKNNSPCTVVRVLGESRNDADTTKTTAVAGWKTTKDFSTAPSSNATADAGGAYGLFVMPNPDSSFAATKAQAASALSTDSLSDLDEFQLLVPTAADGSNTTIRVIFKEALNDPASAAIIHVKKGASDADSATALLAAINGTADQTLARYGNSNAGDSTNGVAGIDATAASTTALTLTATKAGPDGNSITVTNVQGTIAIGASFTGGTAAGGAGAVTGTLAAVWYVNEGAVILTGSNRNGTQVEGAGVLIKGTNGQFTAKITGSAGVEKSSTFNFNRDSNIFIRKVFNTDPTRVNSAHTSDTSSYWLGETFESNLAASENSQLKVTGSAPSNTDQLGVILALDGTTGGSGIVWADHKEKNKAAQTGWFFSQDTRGTNSNFSPVKASHVEKLFKFHALDSGEQANRELKISIIDIKPPSDNFNAFGHFTVFVRKASDNDNNPIVLERFSNINLDPTSANYIARIVGDRNYYYDPDARTITELGNFANRSKYIRVEVSPAVNNGIARKGYLPYGVYGPVVPLTKTWLSGSTAAGLTNSWYAGTGSGNALSKGLVPARVGIDGQLFDGGTTPMTASIEFPRTRLRVSSSEGSLVKANRAYFGYQSNIIDSKRHDSTTVDILRGQPQGHDPHTVSSLGKNQYSWVFTLDDVKISGADSGHAIYVSGSRAAGTSFTATSGSKFILTGSNAGFNRFTSPMFGGTDGLDITEKDPFRNSYISQNQGERTNYAFHSLKKAIDIVSDPEYVEFDVLALPGITNNSLNTQLINACEERGDSLAIIDIEGNYLPPHENALDEQSNLGSVTDAVTNVKTLGINSSYGCAFYPFVQIRDTISDSILYVPPSVVALGTFSSSQRRSAVWFAPAGFTRGGLSEGSSGLPVVGVRKRLTSDERDQLYDANINPIASFPAEGIVIFGQKTLQVTPSALDRINVRRLLIFLKKEISRFAATTLFEQNVQSTWDRFRGRVVPFLESVKSGLGLTDFKVVLDDTTTTPDLIDRNVLYAKIFLKPARSIEFIALDFIITKTGASFDD